MFLDELLLVVNGVTSSNEKILLTNFAIDSKEIKEYGVFICINSGYKYIDDAIKNGAKAIITEKNIDNNLNVIIIKVKSALNALISIARYLLSINHPLKIAITGSNGKTTTKELIKNVLEKKYNVVSNKGNNNNLIGVLKTILNVTDKTEYLVLELGMNHLKEISYLSRIIKPDIGVITNIGTAHIGYLKSQKNIFKAKMEILDGNKDMLLIVNGHDKFLKKVDCYHVLEKEFDIPYKYMQMNYSIAFDLLKLCGFNDDEIISSFREYKMYEHRMNVINKDNYIIIDDTYNASLESTIGGLNYLNNYQQDKIIILGDILELGKYGHKIHKKINKYLKKINYKEILLIGDLTKNIKGKHFNNLDDIIFYLKNKNLSNCVIYLKASHAINLSYVLDELLKS